MRRRQEGPLRWTLAGALALAVLALTGGRAAWASEGGTSSYLPGLADTQAGVLPPPGTYAKETFYFYSGEASEVVLEGRVVRHLHSYSPVQITFISQVTKAQLWGSNYGWAVFFPFLEPKLTGRVVTPAGEVSRSQRTAALGESGIIPLIVGWHNGRSHQKASVAVYLPTGKYDLEDLVNTGLNYWALEFDYAYTFLDPKTGHEFDIAPGYTFNWRNPATDYTSGQEFHMDFAGLKRPSSTWGLGAVGYLFLQTTPDTGSGAQLGPFEGRAYALGPIATYATKWGAVPIAMTGKYYQEFAVTNRLKGHSFWFYISAAF